MKDVFLIRDLLDTQLIDRDNEKMGRIDGIVLTMDDGGPPRIDHFELGLVVLARRVHPRVESWVQSLRDRWSVRRTARQRVPWSSVLKLEVTQVQVDVKASETPGFDWERWLRKHVVDHIPGKGKQ